MKCDAQNIIGSIFALTFFALVVFSFAVMDINIDPVEVDGNGYTHGYRIGYREHDISEYTEMKALEENKRLCRDETYSYACGYINGYLDYKDDEVKKKIENL